MPEQDVSVEDLIRHAAEAAGVPPELALAVAEQESGFNPTAVGPPIDPQGTRAIGTFQLLPQTAAMLGVDPNDPLQNIAGGTRYLQQLLEQHQGDIDQVLRSYGGVRSNTSYVPQVRARMARFATPATPTPGTPPPAPPTFAQNHPYLNAFIQSLDPNEAEGRQNLAGTAGAVTGGAIGALTTPVTGPWGVRIGSALGAGLAGGAEQLLVEETGLGPKLADWLPGSTDVATPPPPPDQSMWRRAAGAAGTQATFDVFGQLLLAPLRYLGRSALETQIGRTAANYYTTAKKTAVDTLLRELDNLKAARDQIASALSEQGREVAARSATATAAERAAAARTTQGVQTAVGERTAAASTRAGEAVTAAEQRAREAMDLARADAEAAEATAREQLQAGVLASAPSEVAAGRQVADVFEGSGRAARDMAGQAVKEAAQSGPPVSIKALQQEARRIAEEELLPPEQAFPRHPQPGLTRNLGEAPPPPPGAIEGEVIGEAPPAVTWPPTNSAKGLWEHVLADAKAQGYAGPPTRLRKLFDAAIKKARELVDHSIEASRTSGPRQLLADIANNGGLTDRKMFEGEFAWFRQATSNRQGKIHGVPGVVRKTGGLSFEQMAERLRQSRGYARFTSGKELVDELTNVVSKGVGDASELTLGEAASQVGLEPGRPWWHQALAEQRAEQVGGLSQQITDAQLQEMVKHPAMGVIARILNAPETVDFYTAHLWKSQLQQALAGSYDDVVKSQMTNITQHLTRLLRESLAGHEPYNAATAAYSGIARLFTEGHAPLIRQVATEAPEKIVQAIGPNDASAARMLVHVLTDQAEVGGGAAGRAQGEQALQAVQAAWVHRHVLQGSLDGLADRVAKAQANPDFVEAFLHTPYARDLLDQARMLGTALSRVQADNAATLAAREAAGRADVLATRQAGEQAVADVQRVGEQEVRGARAAGKGRVSAAQARGNAAAEAERRASEAAGVSAREEIRRKGADIRARRAGTPEEQAFEQSTLAPKYRNAARSALGRQFEWVVRASLAGAGYGAFGPPGIAVGTLLRSPGRASEADLLKYVVHSGPLTRAVINNLFKPGAKVAYNTALSTAMKGVGHSVTQPQVATPPPRP